MGFDPAPPSHPGRARFFVLLAGVGLGLLTGAAFSAPSAPPAMKPAAARLDAYLRRIAFGSSRIEGRFRTPIRPGAAAANALPRQVRGGDPGGAEVVYVRAVLTESAAARAAAEGDGRGPGARGRPLERALADLGIEMRGRVGRVLSLRVPVGSLERLASFEEIAWMRAARPYRLYNDVSTGSDQVASESANLFFGDRGAGAIVAVIDTGIDWTNLDFRNADGTTRLIAIWDQTVSDALHPPPPGFTFGALYTRSDIDAALASSGALPRDGHGHGTHVAGSAAGNGRQTGNGVPIGTFEGVAPEAALLIVRVFDDQGVFCGQCDLTAAVQFIQETAAAEGLPWVGNMSLGTDLGAHDGTDPDELAIDAAVGPARPGAQMAIAAGNQGADRIHWTGTAPAGGVASNSMTVAAYSAQPGSDNDAIFLDLWYDGAQRAIFEIVTPDGTLISVPPGADSGTVCTNDGAVWIDATVAPHPENGDNEVLALIWDSSDCTVPRAPRSGTWTLRARDDGGSGLRVDLWTETTIASGPVTLSPAIFSGTVSVPGTSRHALTVGSYVDKSQWINAAGSTTNASVTNTIGGLSSFSGIGPTRDGRLKPDIAAPGEWIGSTLTGLIGASRGTAFTERDGQHGDIRGTSMATPHVAGSAALMLSLNPGLSGADVRAALARSARGDTLTGTLPNNRFGAGKLRALEAAGQAVSVVPGLEATAAGGFSAPASLFVDSYNVYRGDLGALPSGSYGTCFLSGLPSPIFEDPDVPAAGSGSFYLVVGVQQGIEGILGTDSEGRVRQASPSCP